MQSIWGNYHRRRRKRNMNPPTKLTVFNVSPTIAWRFFERYFDEILSIPWRYNVRTLTWFERNAYDTIVSRKKISWSFSRVFSSGGEHATERSSFKTSCWEHECPFDSSFNGVVKKKKTFAIQSRRYSKCSKTPRPTFDEISSLWDGKNM